MKLTTVALSLLASAVPATAQNLINVTSDTREITCTAFEGPPGNPNVVDGSSDAALFGMPFNTFVAANVTNSGGTFMSGASQDSSIGANSIAIAGTMSGSSSGTGGSSARSLVKIRFSLQTKAKYTLAGSISGFDQGFGEVYLLRGDGSLVEGFFGINEGVSNLNYTGCLDPGLYRLEASCFGETSNGFFASATYDMDLALEPIGGEYCPGAANSVGPGAVLSSTGSQDHSDNNFILLVSGAPVQTVGLMIYGANQGQTPLGNGTLCLSGQVFRLNPPILTTQNGGAQVVLDFNAPPMNSGPGFVGAGSTWNFQFWYRDAIAPPSGFNLSNGLWATFCP